MTDFQQVSKSIRKELDRGHRKFAIFPYGDIGCLTKRVLEEQFGITDVLVLDNYICDYNPSVQPLDVLSRETNEVTVLFACSNWDIYDELLMILKGVAPQLEVVSVIQKNEDKKKNYLSDWHSRLCATKCGKYSYGPLCDHIYVKEIGAFCSIAGGCNVVPNHAMTYISTHPFLTHDKTQWEGFPDYDSNKDKRWYMPGVKPCGKIDRRRITIGNDVWLGQNVIITNYANIGNGVIAGAGTVITKDVPDYAIIVGNPARIIRYRYTEEQIQSLLKIAWWNWDDEKIIKNYADFYLPIDEFIQKYLK